MLSTDKFRGNEILWNKKLINTTKISETGVQLNQATGVTKGKLPKIKFVILVKGCFVNNQIIVWK